MNQKKLNELKTAYKLLMDLDADGGLRGDALTQLLKAHDNWIKKDGEGWKTINFDKLNSMEELTNALQTNFWKKIKEH
jgi:hypothetical protein